MITTHSSYGFSWRFCRGNPGDDNLETDQSLHGSDGNADNLLCRIRGVIWVDQEGESDDDVKAKQLFPISVRLTKCDRKSYHSSLQIIALAILDNICDNQDAQEEDYRLESLEM